MTNIEQLQLVKMALSIVGDYQDNTLLIYVDEVREYLLDAGVPSDYVDSKQAVGIIARGVSDLWNYGSGDAKLSRYFKERVYQLKLK